MQLGTSENSANGDAGGSGARAGEAIGEAGAPETIVI